MANPIGTGPSGITPVQFNSLEQKFEGITKSISVLGQQIRSSTTEIVAAIEALTKAVKDASGK